MGQGQVEGGPAQPGDVRFRHLAQDRRQGGGLVGGQHGRAALLQDRLHGLVVPGLGQVPQGLGRVVLLGKEMTGLPEDLPDGLGGQFVPGLFPQELPEKMVQAVYRGVRIEVADEDVALGEAVQVGADLRLPRQRPRQGHGDLLQQGQQEQRSVQPGFQRGENLPAEILQDVRAAHGAPPQRGRHALALHHLKPQEQDAHDPAVRGGGDLLDGVAGHGQAQDPVEEIRDLVLAQGQLPVAHADQVVAGEQRPPGAQGQGLARGQDEMEPGGGVLHQVVQDEQARCVLDQVVQIVKDHVHVLLQAGLDIAQQQVDALGQVVEDDFPAHQAVLAGCRGALRHQVGQAGPDGRQEEGPGPRPPDPPGTRPRPTPRWLRNCLMTVDLPWPAWAARMMVGFREPHRRRSSSTIRSRKRNCGVSTWGG